MYNAQIDTLINLAVTDGELSEKEKQVLLKRAEAAGIDLDEFAMVLEAKLHERQKQGAISKTKDNVIKCPSCNDIIPALSRICPSCQFVLNANVSSEGGEKGLIDLINEMENILVSIKSIPPPNLINTFYKKKGITIFLFTLIFTVLLWKTDHGVISVLVAIIGSIVAAFQGLVKYALEETGPEKESAMKNLEIKHLVARFEKVSRQAKSFYGENKKIKNLIEECDAEVQQYNYVYKKSNRVNLLTQAVLLLIGLCVIVIPEHFFK